MSIELAVGSAMLEQASDEANRLLDSQPPSTSAEEGYGQALLAELPESRITTEEPVVTAHQVIDILPRSEPSKRTVIAARIGLSNIIHHQGDEVREIDDRLVVNVGPCSVHNAEATIEYAEWLAEQQREYADELLMLMRVYFEKPRTITKDSSWKGMRPDPHLDGSYDYSTGLVLSRQVASEVTERGVPVVTERLYSHATHLYDDDLVSQSVIGARTANGQRDREAGSASPSPVGVKNTPEGNIQIAADSIASIKAPQTYLTTNIDGQLVKVTSAGNPDGFLILRGAEKGPNYSTDHVAHAVEILRRMNLPEAIMVDASHGNSGKDYRRQLGVVREVAAQIGCGQTALVGVAMESNLEEGQQKIIPGQWPDSRISVTDSGIGLEDTSDAFEMLAEAVRQRRKATSTRV